MTKRGRRGSYCRRHRPHPPHIGAAADPVILCATLATYLYCVDEKLRLNRCTLSHPAGSNPLCSCRRCSGLQKGFGSTAR